MDPGEFVVWDKVIAWPDEWRAEKSGSTVNLHNVVTVAKAGVGRRLAQLGDERMHEVRRALAFALGCDS